MKILIYSIVEFFTFGKGLRKTFSGYPVQLPARYINYFDTNYETDNFSFVKASVKPGDTVLDIGAHIGLFSSIVAQMIGPNGKIFAFEPTPATFNLLKKTIAMNGLSNMVETRSEAMGIKVGTVNFYVSETEGDNGNSIVSYKTDRQLTATPVPMVSVDEFVKSKSLTNIDFIKFDVEGAEYDAIRGAKETFKKFRPACILAIHPESIIAKGDTLQDIYDFVTAMPYEILYDGKKLDLSFFLNNKALIDLHLKPLAQ